MAYNFPLLFMATKRALFTPKRLTTPLSTVEISSRPAKETGAVLRLCKAEWDVKLKVTPPHTQRASRPTLLLLESQAFYRLHPDLTLEAELSAWAILLNC